MISVNKATEPIIPMGILVNELGCSVSWEDRKMILKHPRRGLIEVDTESTGCPQISRKLTLELIYEWEDLKKGPKVKGLSRDMKDKLTSWMHELVDLHPTLRTLPEVVKKSLVVEPGEWGDIPANRRARKVMRRDGMMVHLYAGPDNGFTLSRALQQVGGQDATTHLLEVDKLRSESHDMLKDEGVYRGLVAAAVEGQLRALVMGPNCRTRSVLRHRPLPSGRPRPVRSWEDGQEWGLKDLDNDEKRMVEEDDILMWRGIFLFIVSRYASDARGQHKEPVRLLIEQPASPRDYQPEVVSFWDTWEWKQLKKEFTLHETHVNQGDYGGRATKPTTFGGDLEITPPTPRPRGRSDDVVSDSKELSRWAPGIMTMVARALQEKVRGEAPHLRALSWSEHIRYNHTPYRRDCRVCQETLQKQRPHRRIQHPWAGVLSLDTAGPMVVGQDIHQKSRYLLVGTYTWLVPKGDEKQKEPEQGDPPDDGPRIERDALEAEEEEPQGDAREELHPGLDQGDDPAQEDGLERLDGQIPEEERPPDDMEFRVYRLVIPIPHKGSKDTVKGATEMIMRLRADGYHVSRIHTDQGKEFRSRFEEWAKSRGYHVTRTAGDDPQGNGRAEVAVQYIKTLLRRSLHEAGQEAEFWPLAARHINEVLHHCRRGDGVNFPAFMSTVIARKRGWKRSELEAVSEEVRYIAPAWAEHGHWVMREDGSIAVTRYTLKPAKRHELDEAWIALELEEEGRDPLMARRRIRGKRAVKDLRLEEVEEDGSDEEEQRRMRIMKIIEDEMVSIFSDPWDMVEDQMKMVMKMKQMVEGVIPITEEVLQTRIVGIKEVVREWKQWIPAVDSEVKSLLEDKKALQRMSREEYAQLKRTALAEGRSIEELPSKMVWAVKPDPGNPQSGKKKARWVICGNFEPEKENEENYSGGADATAFRVLVKKAAEEQWSGSTLDIKTAFLNAELEDSTEIIIIRPPHVLLMQKYMEEGEVFMAKKAVYGLRRSPRLWGLTRDRGLRQMRLDMGGDKWLILEALVSEPNLWRIVESGGFPEPTAKDIKGLLMTYVDDMFMVGPPEVLRQLERSIRSLWASTEPEEVGEKPVRFLGMEVTKVLEDGEDVWYITQESYIRDMLKDYEVKGKRLPITKDQCLELETKEEDSTDRAQQLKEAQKSVGELLWTVTRSRPDLMFSIAKMGGAIQRNPRAVAETAAQVRGYLLETSQDGLRMARSSGSFTCLEVCTDASFGDHSHGCLVVSLGGTPLLWRSGRQGVQTSSTAEAELMEIQEGMVAGESVFAIIQEVFEGMPRILWSDSQAALAIMTNEGGSWRTRHLRFKAASARGRVACGDWSLRHLPGEQMIADLGTKPLTGTRLTQLKKEMGMKVQDREVDEKGKGMPEESVSSTARGGEPHRRLSEDQRKATMALKLLTMAAMIRAGKGEDPLHRGGETGESELQFIIGLYTVAVMVVTILVWVGMQKLFNFKKFLREGQAGEVERPQNVSREENDCVDGPDGEHTAQRLDQALEDPEVDEDAQRPSSSTPEEVASRHVEPSAAAPNYSVVVTKSGSKFHRLSCPTLANTKMKVICPWCPKCGKMLPEELNALRRPAIWTKGPGKTVHLHQACEPQTRRYVRCQVCQPDDSEESRAA